MKKAQGKSETPRTAQHPERGIQSYWLLHLTTQVGLDLLASHEADLDFEETAARIAYGLVASESYLGPGQGRDFVRERAPIRLKTQIISSLMNSAASDLDLIETARRVVLWLLASEGYLSATHTTLSRKGKEREKELLTHYGPTELEEAFADLVDEVQTDARPNGYEGETVSFGERHGASLAILDVTLMRAEHNIWLINRLNVPAAARKQGVARRLIEKFVQRFIDKEGNAPGWLVVMPGGYNMNPTEQTEAYLHLGFVPVIDGVLVKPLNDAGELPVTLDDLDL